MCLGSFSRTRDNIGYIVGFGLVEIAISTNPKPVIYRDLYVNTALQGWCLLTYVYDVSRFTDFPKSMPAQQTQGQGGGVGKFDLTL